MNRKVTARGWAVLCCTWLLIAMIAFLDTRAVAAYVAVLDASSTLTTDHLPLRRSAPADNADTKTWVRLALELDERSEERLRWTTIDNAPAGRAVHWSSAFMHVVHVAGTVQRALTGAPMAVATEGAVAWLNLPLLLAVVVVFSAVIARVYGMPVAALLALGMIGHRFFYAGFAPNNVDHHGLLSAASLGVVLGLLCMGAGWYNPADDSLLLPRSPGAARGAAWSSAAAGAFGLLISAASILPVIAFAGAGGLLATVLAGRHARRAGAVFEPALWRTWSRAGAGLSLVAYIAEYAPSHLGFRLEVNHPLYALAWLSGGELVAVLSVSYLNRSRVPAARATACVAGLLCAPIVIAMYGSQVFALRDPRLIDLHGTIAEFQSLPSLVHAGGFEALGPYLIGFALLLPAVMLLKSSRADRVGLVFAGVTAGLCVTLACWQVRWWMAASGPELVLLMAAAIASSRAFTGWPRRAGLVLLGAVFLGVAASRVILTRANVAEAAVSEVDAADPLYRDIAVAIRASQPKGDVVLLAGPNASTGIGYFGRLRVLGTLYWENLDGLAAAAAIFSALEADEAQSLVRQRGVTHVALVGRDGYLKDYLRFHAGTGASESFTNTFGSRLGREAIPPRWLREIPFADKSSESPALFARVFQVVPEQTDAEATWHAAEALVIRDAEVAEQLFRGVVAIAPAEERAALLDQAGRIAYRTRAYAASLRLFDSALALGPSTATVVAAAWIRATGADDDARDGARALRDIEPLLRSRPDDPAVLDVAAAALAELGRFDEAVAVARRMVSLQDAATRPRGQAHLESYRARRPWRN